MTDGLMAVAETRKPGVDAILVGKDVRTFGFSMIGWMVACWTSIRITTSRSIMPKIGGFSFSKVPRLPFNLLRRPFGPHRLGIALVPGDDVELVELDVAAQDHLGCLRHDAVAQHHGLNVALAQTEFVRDLTVRQVHPHEVRAQDPGRDGLMMSGKNSSRQVIEAILACLAQVSLSVPLAIVMAVTAVPQQ
jgi:hypothetical protein